MTEFSRIFPDALPASSRALRPPQARGSPGQRPSQEKRSADTPHQTIVSRTQREQPTQEATLLERLSRAVSAKISEIFIAP
jgi:hypothetical protein